MTIAMLIVTILILGLTSLLGIVMSKRLPKNKAKKEETELVAARLMSKMREIRWRLVKKLAVRLSKNREDIWTWPVIGWIIDKAEV